MLFRFYIELSDIDRGIYQALDLRLAQHPSETPTYLITRVLAYVLSYREGLEFTPAGLGDPEAPALKALGSHGTTDLWIEIGNPSTRKLHKASKSSRQVIVYTYKNAEQLVQQIREGDVHRVQDLEIYALDSKFLAALELQIEKTNRWSILHQQGHIDIDTGHGTFATDVKSFSLA